MAQPKPRIFFDADALMAGTHSPTGGAGFLLLQAAAGLITIIISPQVIEEVRRNLTAKLPQSLTAFDSLLSAIPFEHVLQPSTKARAACLHLADAKDAAHVATSVRAKATFLVTFNLRHYQIKAIRKELSIAVLTPGQLIAELRAIDVVE